MLPSDLENPFVWVLYLHLYAMLGQGQINKHTVAHMNVQDTQTTIEQEILFANFAYEDNNNNKDFGSNEEEEVAPLPSEQELNIPSPSTALPLASLEVLDQIPPPQPGQNPLSLSTVKQRLQDVI
ncbi:uncharacterized protein UTRI_10686 [Ustilago trichophora]|uniref:Uncharacterized protein n=1 Tax=Ustilago trichophora TaxID=86804 RepID=A0A5C3E8I5_9BASI|nr:uncharacterized protein UTRI_10686 [Ustilago trichophora]